MSTSVATRPTSRWPWLVLLAGLLLGLLAASFVPGSSLGRLAGATGDADLAARTRAAVGDARGFDTFDVAEVRDGQVRLTTVGPQQGRFEPGSITKLFTGHLLAVAIERGEVRLEDPLARHLPTLAGTPAGDITLRALATHTSGLPREGASLGLGALRHQLALHDPFDGVDVGALLADARSASLTKPGEFAYSNLGAGLLGHALAAGGGAPDWPTLARTRLFEPLGMNSTSIATTDAEVPAAAVQGYWRNGLSAMPWTSPGNAPAGSSTWTTAADMARFAQHVVDGTAPGMGAVEVQDELSKTSRIGMFWMHRPVDGRDVLWHNGSTGGAGSMLALDRDAKRAVVILGNTAQVPKAAGFALLADATSTDKVATPWLGLGLVAASVATLGLLVARSLRPRSVVGWASLALAAAGLLLLTWRLGPWTVLPLPVMGALAGLAVACLVVAVPRLRAARRDEKRPVLGWLGLLVNLGVLVLLGVAVWA